MRSLTSMARRGSVFGGTVAGALAVALAFSASASAAPVVVTSLVTLAKAATGQGWAKHPDQTANSGEAFVQGPATPPVGRGSLLMKAEASTDRALIFTVPNPGTGPVPPGSIAAFIASPWGTLSGSYSTFTTNSASTASSVPVLKFVGYHVFNSNNPLLSTGFTTLNFSPAEQSTAPAPNVWQTWTLGPDSKVFQSNTSDDFCTITASCTLSAFAAHYPRGAWGQVQIGLGSGAPANASGNVDNVNFVTASKSFSYDFDVPAAPSSSPAPTTSAPSTTTTASTASTASSTASTSAFVPGPGATGDSGSTNTPAWLIAASALGVLTLGSVATARRRRHPHHS